MSKHRSGSPPEATEQQLAFLSTLIELGARSSAEFDEFLQGALKADAELLGVERVSYWTLERDPPGIRCVSLYRRSTGGFGDGAALFASAHPHYLDAMKRDLVIDAPDVSQDPRTRSFLHDYLEPVGIGALLDVPIWVQGALGGVLCHEHVGGPRRWSSEEKSFALSVGHLVSMAAEAEQRRRAERLLYDTEQQLALLLETGDVDLVMLDPNGQIRLGAERIQGFRTDELTGQSLDVLYSPEDVAHGRPKKAVELALQSGRYDEEDWVVRKDGSRYWAQISYRAVKDRDGRVRAVARLTRDLTRERLMTEREQLLSETWAAEEQQRVLSEAGKALGASFDYEANLNTVARLLVPLLADACMIHVFEPTQGLVRAATKVLRPGVGLELTNQVETVLRADTRAEKGEMATRHWQQLGRAASRGDAEAVRLARLGVTSCSVLPMVHQGEPIGMLTLFTVRGRRFRKRDPAVAEEIARRAAAAVANARLYRKVHAALGTRDEFLAVAAHELRTPLTALHLQLQSLRHLIRGRHIAGLTDTLRQKLDTAGRQTQRLARLVESLMEVSTAQTGLLTLAREQVDLGALVRDVCERLQSEAARADSPLVVEVAKDVVGRWDPTRLEQLVTNLLTNAFKFGAHHRIEVSVEDRDDLALIRVVDHGIGIVPEDLERVFERFGRGAGAAGYGGLGLGLYVVKQIAEAHGGTVHVASRPNEGSTFTVLLPKVVPEQLEPPPFTAEGAPPSTPPH